MRLTAALSLLFATLPLFVTASPIRTEDIARNAANGLRLLSLADGAKPVWKTEAQMFDLIRAGVKFVCPPFPFLLLLFTVLLVRCH